jgi:hypothetical protein
MFLLPNRWTSRSGWFFVRLTGHAVASGWLLYQGLEGIGMVALSRPDAIANVFLILLAFASLGGLLLSRSRFPDYY